MRVLPGDETPSLIIIAAPCTSVEGVENGWLADAVDPDDASEPMWGIPAADGSDDAQPDLTDPATLGALLGAVREAYQEPRIYAKPYGGGWACIGVPTPGADGLAGMLAPILGHGPTEAEALLAAWNARPRSTE